ncbi:hypothetical protein LOTGIDRAFT_168287 [Lottia gigantea]|uniref:CCDC113/CCDC96 coiled-coil domain-containing protein n=1 Tax=Lottia gigantea TaxID=225164 RepID=V4B8G8_LOTGI|nr:hypothetical protein LOTGIDRAFT_168287 [Lottia gigantea]ESO85024.1 hypothetical protein LOTGIDRAFT_168287 [Lottia gigantea]
MADGKEEETKAVEEVSETKEETKEDQPTEIEAAETPKDASEKTQDEPAEGTQEESPKVTEEETSAQGEDQTTETPNVGNNANDDVVKSNDNDNVTDIVVNDLAENANDNAQNIGDVSDNAQNVNDNTDVNDIAQNVNNENKEADDNTVKEGSAESGIPEVDQPEGTTLTDTGGDDQKQPEEPEAAKEQTEAPDEAGEKVEGEGAAVVESGEVKEDQNAEKVEGDETPQAEEKPSSEKGESPEEGAAPAGDGETPAGDGETPAGDNTTPAGDGETPAGDGETPGVESQPLSGEEQSPSGEQAEDSTKSPIPQSDTFTEGDRAESPVPQTVGEKLSRGPTPALDDMSREDTQTEMLEPGTPERPGTPVEGETQQDVQNEADEEKTPEPQFDREALIEKYNAALAEREQLKQQNYQLQHKLAEYFRKKKSDDRTDYDKNVTDQEQRYLKYMDQLQELQKLAKREKETYKLQINDLEDKCKERKKKVDEERNKFTEFKQVVALNSLNSRSGKPIPPKEELAEGLHLIDFEQLKIENQTYNEKIEERNEELLKLRKKITSTVQVLTHLKEKLQFVQAENQVQKKNLNDVEALVGQKRDILSRTKQARDSLRIDNHKLRQNCGLLGNEPLLRDFEERKDEGDDLKIKLEELRSIHAELALNCNQVRRKIEQARMGQV